MIERLNILEKRYNEIVEDLGNPDILSDYSKTLELSKEKGRLEPTITKYNEYKSLKEEIEGLKDMVNDPEMGEMAKLELEESQNKLATVEDELQVLLIPKDPNDEKNIIMEIRGAAGGDEANIFAGDLYRMYTRYAEKQGFKTEIIDLEEGTAGGFSQIEFVVKGDGAYSKLKYENGSHRVQRVPETESQGRIQTSTATVAVMPEAEDIDFKLNMDEIRVDITRASGNGGQGVNTTDSAVRLTHIPTGIIVYSQQERSQIKNKEIAMKIMASRLYDLQLREKEEKEGDMRRSLIGSGDRSEKIRTYNYPQSRVTDHRIGFTIMQLDRVMNGDLDPIIDALITEDQRKKLASDEAK